MSKHRRFTDSAGFTRHCWECSHAKQWTPNVISGPFGWCELTGRSVGKFDSPNNQCSHVGPECDYKEDE